MRIIILLALGFLVSITPNEKVFAQGCCTAGSSTFGGLERGIAKTGSLNLGISFIENSLSTTYNQSEQIPDPLNREASVSSFNLELELGLSEKVSLLIIGGYVLKNRETSVQSNVTNETEVVSFKGNGVSDITVLGKYELISPSIISPFGVSIGGCAKLPVGSFTQANDGS